MIIWEITIGEIVTGLILLGTAFIVWLYTKEAQKSNEIKERPVVNLYLRETCTSSNTERVLCLRNVGNGPAYNIKFFGIVANGYTYYPHFNEANPILEKHGDEKTVDLWVATPTGGVEVYERVLGFEFLLQRLFVENVRDVEEYKRIARSAATFLITYEGVNNNIYYSIFRLYSKIPPMLRVYDLVVEFISNGQGVINLFEAKSICDKKVIMEKNDQ